MVVSGIGADEETEVKAEVDVASNIGEALGDDENAGTWEGKADKDRVPQDASDNKGDPGSLWSPCLPTIESLAPLAPVAP